MKNKRIYISPENVDKLDKEELKRHKIHICLNMNFKEMLEKKDESW